MNPLAASYSQDSNATAASVEPTQRIISTSSSIQSINTNTNAEANVNQLNKTDKFGSVGNIDQVDSDDDIDETFEKAKRVSNEKITEDFLLLL